MYRHAREARIYDGPDEVHVQSVARRILKNYENNGPGGILASEMHPSILRCQTFRNF